MIDVKSEMSAFIERVQVAQESQEYRPDKSLVDQAIEYSKRGRLDLRDRIQRAIEKAPPGKYATLLTAALELMNTSDEGRCVAHRLSSEDASYSLASVEQDYQRVAEKLRETLSKLN